MDWYDFHARQYDPALGRFTSVDPHAENYLDWTPYNFVGNNPINLIDPNGMDWYVHGESGNLHWYNGQYEEDNTPEGYSHLGADDYFGEESFTHLQEALSMYEENVGESLNSLDFTTEESEVLAAEYGFSRVPTKQFHYTSRANTPIAFNGVVSSIYDQIIIEAYSYAQQIPKWNWNYMLQYCNRRDYTPCAIL